MVPIRSARLFTLALVLLVVGLAMLLRAWSRPLPPLPSFTPSSPPAFQPLNPPARPGTETRLVGRVDDEASNPLANVTVYLLDEGIPRWAVSDAAGRFDLARIGTGPCELVLLDWGRPVHTVLVEPGPEPLRVAMPPPLPPMPALPEIERSALVGRLATSMAELEPQQREVVLLPSASPAAFGGAVARRVLAERDGSFRFEDLAHGSYKVLVLPEWARGGLWPDLVDPAVSTLVHPAGAGKSLPLAEGAIEARVLDEQGRVLEGALVVLAPESSPTLVWPPQNSDGFGRFRFGDLPPGAYTLQLHAGAANLQTRVEVRAGRATRVDLPPVQARGQVQVSSGD